MPCDQPGTMCLLSTRRDKDQTWDQPSKGWWSTGVLYVHFHVSCLVRIRLGSMSYSESRSTDFYPFICSDRKRMKSTYQTDCRSKLCAYLVVFFFFSLLFHRSPALQFKEFCEFSLVGKLGSLGVNFTSQNNPAGCISSYEYCSFETWLWLSSILKHGKEIKALQWPLFPGRGGVGSWNRCAFEQWE